MKDFTLHPEALELKELGFDEPCFGYYHNLGSKQLLISLRNLKEDNNSEIEYFVAPTYSQCFRWFRQEYALESYIRANLCVDVPKTYQFNIDDNIDDVWYDTYEEAELACLREMIKIIKEKQK